ncbi:PA14 domain-containing protein [Streptomyces sp. YIM 98790]|uniref:fibronectin type III domain-containing protein n=1 Tax=Streptomyces sp. YIM 98790 TaxID=2689077 RepID=UPI00140A8EA9|nr:PA14 domain-containing protein [Streptomyces sp. YIM 98790]
MKKRNWLISGSAAAAVAAGTSLVVVPPAQASVSCSSTQFTREFFSNGSLSGTPVKKDCDGEITEWWAGGAPLPGMPSDNFSVRWTLTRDFGSGGPFNLYAAAHDGIRVYLDGTRTIDLWKDTTTQRSRTVQVTIPRGRHTLRIEYANWSGSASAKFRYAPRTSTTDDHTPPLAPADLTAWYSEEAGQAKLNWAESPEMDLAGYRVYRRPAGTDHWTRVSGTAPLTSPWFKEQVAADGSSYDYQVRAVDKAGNESAGAAATVAAQGTPPPAPTGVEENWEIGDSTVAKLYWQYDADVHIAGYRVYRSTGLPVETTEANLVSGSTLLTSGYFREDLPQTGHPYYYVVTAVKANGAESEPSRYAVFYTEDTTGPANRALDPVASVDERGVTLTWETSAETSPDFSGFVVYRSTQPRAAGGQVASVGRTWGTTFTDTTPVPQGTHYYWIVASDYSSNKGTPSVDVMAEVPVNTTPPPAVAGLTAEPRENGVALSWDGDESAGIAHYVLFRGTLAGGEWRYEPMLDHIWLTPLTTTEETYFHRTLPDAEQVRYSVVAVDQYGNRLSPGSEAAVVELTELDMRPPVEPAPGGPFVSLSADQNGRVVWLVAAEAERPAEEITGFLVHRWNRGSGDWELLAELPEDDWSYYDRTIPGGTTTYYRVAAVYQDGETIADDTYAVTY